MVRKPLNVAAPQSPRGTYGACSSPCWRWIVRKKTNLLNVAQQFAPAISSGARRFHTNRGIERFSHYGGQLEEVPDYQNSHTAEDLILEAREDLPQALINPRKELKADHALLVE